MIKQYQGLRFLAFLLVFATHAAAFRWFDLKIAYGLWAVSFFFGLSAFMMGFGDRGEPFSWRGTLAYVWGKVKRFYPLAFISIVVSLRFCKGLWCLLSGGNPCPTYWECLPVRHFLLVQSWWRDGIYEFSSPCWFLSTLVFLYLVVRLVLPALRRLRSGVLVTVAVGCLSLVALWDGLVASWEWDVRFWMYIFPPAKVPEFLAFVCFGILCARGKARLAVAFGRGFRGTALDLLLAAGLVGTFVVFDNTTGSVMRWQILNVILFCTFSFSGGLLARVCGCRILDALGTLSMPMFLLHNNVLNFVIGRLTAREAMPTSPSGQCFWFVVCLVLTLAVGAVYLKVDTWVRRRGK